MTKPLIVNKTFTDVDELSVAMNIDRDYRLTQLQCAPVNYHLNLVDFGIAQFFFLKSTCPVHALGEKSQDCIEFVVLLNEPTEPYLSHYTPMSSTHLFGFDTSREANSLLPPHIQLALFRVKETCLQDYLEMMNRTDIDHCFLKQNYLYLPQTLSTVKNYLKQFFYIVKNSPQLLTTSQLQKLVIEDFLPLLIASIQTEPGSSVSSLSLRFRRQLVHEARDYMMEHLDQPITLKDLCKALHAGSRTISYGFQEVFGLSPIAYLKILRLHEVRKALKVADPSQRSVKEIAHYFGFWSAGHFTRDYKTFFGELPSTTLHKR
jgi:AraC family ethanolamine operon transcriptional activator